MKVHALGGTPRSGSTLLCNLLNTRPDTFASSSSPLAPSVVAAAQALAGRPEFTSELGNDPRGTQARGVSALQGLIRGWYAHRKEQVVIDKDRSNIWLLNREMFRSACPGSKLVITVRDPRAVMGSILKRQDTHPMTQMGGTVADRATALFGASGLVGTAMRSVENILALQNANPALVDHVIFVAYEGFVANPGPTMAALDQALGLDPYEYDFDNVPRYATDRDELYGFLWPHDGSGKVEVKEPDWPRWVPPQVANQLLSMYPLYCQAFGYKSA